VFKIHSYNTSWVPVLHHSPLQWVSAEEGKGGRAILDFHTWYRECIFEKHSLFENILSNPVMLPTQLCSKTTKLQNQDHLFFQNEDRSCQDQDRFF